MKTTLNNEQLEQLVAAWEAAPDVTREVMLDAIVEIDQFLEREIKEDTPVGIGGGGGLRGSITSDEEVDGTRIIGIVGTALAYAEAVEVGTKPHRPPVQPLIDWARQVLGLSGDEAERAGFAIANKIKREGTEGAFMFQEGLKDSEGFISRRLDRAVGDLVEAVLP